MKNEDLNRPNKMMRVKLIDDMLRAAASTGNGLKISDIARRLNTEIRTIQRDIAFMRDKNEFPIKQDYKNHTYYYEQKDLDKTSFGTLYLDNDDKLILSLAKSLLLSFYSGTDQYWHAWKTFDNLDIKLNEAPQIIKHPLRDAILLALPQKYELDDINKFVPAINQGLCVHCTTKGVDGTETKKLIRPINIIYAWSSWYLLYIDESFSYNPMDFRIIKTDLIKYEKISSIYENASIPYLEFQRRNKAAYDFTKPVKTICRIEEDLSDESDIHECLYVEIYGNTEYPYGLTFRRNKDNTLRLVNGSRSCYRSIEENHTSEFLKILDKYEGPHIKDI